MAEPINPADFTKTDLQDFASGENLPTSGTKAQLAERLDEHFAPNADEAAAAFEPEEPELEEDTAPLTEDEIRHARSLKSKAMEQEAKERGNGRIGGSVFDHAPGKPSTLTPIVPEEDEGDEDE